MDDNTFFIWLIFLLLLFYVYFDMRINRLKKELLEHYKLFEDILSNKKEKFENVLFSYGSVKPYSVSDIQSILPTRSEQISWNNGFNLDSIDYASVNF